MIKQTTGFSTSLLPETIDTWGGGFSRVFAQQHIACAVSKGIYPIKGNAWLGIAVKVDADMTGRLQRYERSADRSAPVMALSFSEPVRISADFLPGYAATPGARWVCGEYAVAISRVVLDGNGRVTLDVEADRLLSLLARHADGLLNMGQRCLKLPERLGISKVIQYLGYSGAPATADAQSDFFKQLVDALLTPMQPQALMPGAAIAQPPNSPAAQAHGQDRYCARVTGTLHESAQQHALDVVLQHPVGRALLPPSNAWNSQGAGTYRFGAEATYDAGHVRLHAEAQPDAGRACVWELFAKALPLQKPRLEQALVLALEPTRPPVLVGDGPALAPPLAPLVGLVHGFTDLGMFKENGALPAPQRPAPLPFPLPPLPPAVAPGLPAGMAPEVEEPLRRMLGDVQLRAQASLSAGIHNTGGFLPNSRLIAPTDGRLELEVETKPPSATNDVRLQRAALRWTGDAPLILQLGFAHYLFGATIGRFLDEILHVRIRGLGAGPNGRIAVDGAVYLFGRPICKIDTLAGLAERLFPEKYPMPRVETDVAQWLQGTFLHPVVPASNDDTWRSWRDICAMDLGLQLQLKPLHGDRLRADFGPAGRFETAALAANVTFADTGDATLTIASGSGETACFDFNYAGDVAVEGKWSGRVDMHVLPYPQGTVVTDTTVDETRITGRLDMAPTGSARGLVRTEVSWAAAYPEVLHASAKGHLATGLWGGAGEIEATAHFAGASHGVPAAGHPAVGDASYLMLDRATWKLDTDVVTPYVTVQAGAGGFSNQLTAQQQARLMALRPEQA